MSKECVRESKEFIAWAYHKLEEINYERYKISSNVADYEEQELEFDSWLDENYCQLVDEFYQTDDGCV